MSYHRFLRSFGLGHMFLYRIPYCRFSNQPGYDSSVALNTRSSTKHLLEAPHGITLLRPPLPQPHIFCSRHMLTTAFIENANLTIDEAHLHMSQQDIPQISIFDGPYLLPTCGTLTSLDMFKVGPTWKVKVCGLSWQYVNKINIFIWFHNHASNVSLGAKRSYSQWGGPQRLFCPPPLETFWLVDVQRHRHLPMEA